MENQFDFSSTRQCSGGNSTVLDYYRQYLTKNCVLYFHFSYLYFSLVGNIIVYPPSQSTNREKYFRHQHIKVKNADSGGK